MQLIGWFWILFLAAFVGTMMSRSVILRQRTWARAAATAGLLYICTLILAYMLMVFATVAINLLGGNDDNLLFSQLLGGAVAIWIVRWWLNEEKY